MADTAPIDATLAPPRKKSSHYPEPFASRFDGRLKQPLGDLFGLGNIGINRTTLLPGACSALRHWHTVQDEFVYILAGHPTLITDAGETELSPDMCMGFRANEADGHQLVNRTNQAVIYLEMGDRRPGDAAHYPDDDLQATLDSHGTWQFRHKNGAPYDT